MRHQSRCLSYTIYVSLSYVNLICMKLGYVYLACVDWSNVNLFLCMSLSYVDLNLVNLSCMYLSNLNVVLWELELCDFKYCEFELNEMNLS